MKKVWVITDTDYLCWRAFFTTGELDNGIAFGVLKEIDRLGDRFDPSSFVFAFDRGKPLRKLDYPKYKSNRHDLPPEVRRAVKAQIKLLRREYLPALGFSNIFYQKGYEGDDVLAGIVLQNVYDRVIIVSADRDLFQLLSRRVSIYNPHSKQLLTAESFSDEYGVPPTSWADVKGLSGCSSDCIQGITGVGEKTACKFLTGKLNPNSKAFQSIVKGNKTWRRNLHLVRLPYPGIRHFDIVEGQLINYKKWNKLTERLGMHSILKR